MDFGLHGKVALITASSDGIGKNVAETLAREGADVVLLARSADKLDAIATRIRGEHGRRVLAVSGSMLDEADLDRAFSLIADEMGGLDILVLNTGRPPGPLRDAKDETDTARWEQSYDTLLGSVVQVAKRAIPLMTSREWGRMVAITSASVHLPMPHHALSTVFRAGVEAYMKHLASELGPKRVTVNCVAPALIDSSHRQTATAYTPEQQRERLGMTPLGRLGSQEELCSLVAFLVSRQAGFITGETVRVDGGMATGALHR